jgi:hypothetical protein
LTQPIQLRRSLSQADTHAKGLERKKGQTKKPLVLDFPDSAAVLDAESILAKSVSGHAAGAGDIVSMPRRSEERLQDVSV